METSKEVKDYIKHSLDNNQSHQKIVQSLVGNGWNQADAEAAVSNVSGNNKSVPPPPSANVPPPPAAGLAYVAPAQSKIALFFNIGAVGLWVSGLMLGWLIAALLFAAEGGQEVGTAIVFVVSGLVAFVPMALIGHTRLESEIAKNKATLSDITLKRGVRISLYLAAAATVISGMVFVYNLLSGAFLEEGVEVTDIMASLTFAVILGLILLYYIRLHNMIQQD